MLRRAARRIHDRWAVARDPVGYARRIGVTVGADCRLIGIGPQTFGAEPYLISIGSHVTITANVRFITHDGGVWVLRDRYPNIDVVGRIVVHDNVFIGVGAILLPGIEIGPNAIVAAGAVVSRSVAPESVAAGVPARVIRSLAEYETSALSQAVHVRHLSDATRRRVYSASGYPRAAAASEANSTGKR